MNDTRQTTNISELHRLTRLDRQTLGKILKHLSPVEEGPKNARNYYLYDCTVAIFDYLKERHGESPRQRRTAAEAEKVEIEVARLRASLVPTELMRRSAGSLIETLMRRCVEEAPAALAEKIAATPDHAEVEIAIRDYFAAIFDELRSNPSAFMSLPADADADEGD